jgi:hypothetical protein
MKKMMVTVMIMMPIMKMIHNSETVIVHDRKLIGHN